MKQILLAMVLWMLCAEAGHAQYAVIGKDTIPAEVETAYVKGLKSLVATQKADGSWDGHYGAEPAVVGLAVMAMLAHGDDPEIGPYKEAIRRGIGYIISHSNAKTGQIGVSTSMTLYSHGFATLALAEAYGMVDDPLIGPTLQRAVDFLVAAQKRNPLGAWRYKADSTDDDTTVAGAQMVGLFAARNAGLNVPDEVIEKGLKYYKSCQGGNGSVAYMAGVSAGGEGRLTTTAIGMLVYTLARQKDTTFYRAAAGFFKSNQAAMVGWMFYHEYYAAQAAFHCDEATWQAWNAANIQRMIRMQDSSGGWSGGAFSTAGALLSLALNYRYLPIYER